MLIMMKYKQNEACNGEQAKQRPDPMRKLPSNRAPVLGCPPPHLPPIPSTIHHQIKDSTPTPTPISQIQSKKNSTAKNQVLKLTHIPDSINNPKQNKAHACLSHLIKTFQLLGHTQIHIQSRIGESEKHSGNHVCLLEKWVMKMNRAGSDGESISVYV